MDVKKGLFIVFMFFMIGCNNQKQPTTSENFEWLVGHWERIADSNKIITKETWKKVNDTLYQSHGFSLKQQDTIWQEIVHLKKHQKQWLFEVLMPVNKNTTAFVLTKIKQHSFVAENPTNDFPKIISYQKVKNQIHASIENGEQKIDIIFDPKP